MRDLVLSSGFLAFARQAGFLAAVEEAGVAIDGVVGTSSGALAGSLWCAGHSAARIADELSARRPLALCRPHAAVWRGLFTMDAVMDHLSGLLPARFEDLPRPFGVGVVRGGRHHLITTGPLVPAVAASMAIPRLFVPIDLGGACSDGAFADRTALDAWRAHRGPVDVLVHLVDASSGADTGSDVSREPVVRTPRSFASLWSLGDFTGQLAEARERTHAVLAALDPVK